MPDPKRDPSYLRGEAKYRRKQGGNSLANGFESDARRAFEDSTQLTLHADYIDALERDNAAGEAEEGVLRDTIGYRDRDLKLLRAQLAVEEVQNDCPNCCFCCRDSIARIDVIQKLQAQLAERDAEVVRLRSVEAAATNYVVFDNDDPGRYQHLMDALVAVEPTVAITVPTPDADLIERAEEGMRKTGLASIEFDVEDGDNPFCVSEGATAGTALCPTLRAALEVLAGEGG